MFECFRSNSKTSNYKEKLIPLIIDEDGNVSITPIDGTEIEGSINWFKSLKGEKLTISIDNDSWFGNKSGRFVYVKLDGKTIFAMSERLQYYGNDSICLDSISHDYACEINEKANGNKRICEELMIKFYRLKYKFLQLSQSKINFEFKKD